MPSRLPRIALAVLLMAAVSSSAFASCLPDDMQAAAEMACCVKGHHECGSSVKPADCCQSAKVSSPQFLATKAPEKSKPVVVVSFVQAAVIQPLAVTSIVNRALHSLNCPSPPLFLLNTALRL